MFFNHRAAFGQFFSRPAGLADSVNQSSFLAKKISNSTLLHRIVALFPCRTIDRSSSQEIIDNWLRFLLLCHPDAFFARGSSIQCVVVGQFVTRPAELANSVNCSSCLAKQQQHFHCSNFTMPLIRDPAPLSTLHSKSTRRRYRAEFPIVWHHL